MGKLDRIALLVGALAALGCGEKRMRESEAVEAVRAATAAQTRDVQAPADDRFDAQGRLKPSGRRFSWLELPAGFVQQPGATASNGVWEASNMPLDKVTEYLESKLRPGAVELRPNGVVYQRAQAAHTQLPLPPLAATALTVDVAAQKVRLILDDLTPPREPPLPPQVAERELAKERNRMD